MEQGGRERCTWDPAKQRSNLRRHGVDFLEAATVLIDQLAVTVPDDDHSDLERRSRTIGWSSRGRLLVVITSDRGQRPRIISAWRATKRDRHAYERR